MIGVINDWRSLVSHMSSFWSNKKKKPYNYFVHTAPTNCCWPTRQWWAMAARYIKGAALRRHTHKLALIHPV
jgi:hypothetical protein